MFEYCITLETAELNVWRYLESRKNWSSRFDSSQMNKAAAKISGTNTATTQGSSLMTPINHLAVSRGGTEVGQYSYLLILLRMHSPSLADAPSCKYQSAPALVRLPEKTGNEIESYFQLPQALNAVARNETGHSNRIRDKHYVPAPFSSSSALLFSFLL